MPPPAFGDLANTANAEEQDDDDQEYDQFRGAKVTIMGSPS
jgi:hypothetical protein